MSSQQRGGLGGAEVRIPSPTSWFLLWMGGLHGMTERAGSSACDVATPPTGLRTGGVSLYTFCGDKPRNAGVDPREFVYSGHAWHYYHL